MEYQQYVETLRKNYGSEEEVGVLNASKFYEERFEMAWLATKLKEFSFVTFEEQITLQKIKDYSENCLNYALREYKGLPRGFQNGVVSFNVLAGNTVDNAAIDFATARPTKHFSAFEMPVIVDLQKEKLFYYSATPMWGMIYYKHFREYIQKNFSI